MSDHYSVPVTENMWRPVPLGTYEYPGTVAGYVSRFCNVVGAFPCERHDGALALRNQLADPTPSLTLNNATHLMAAHRQREASEHLRNEAIIQFAPPDADADQPRRLRRVVFYHAGRQLTTVRPSSGTRPVLSRAGRRASTAATIGTLVVRSDQCNPLRPVRRMRSRSTLTCPPRTTGFSIMPRSRIINLRASASW